jgi:hypothetical protein
MITTNTPDKAKALGEKGSKCDRESDIIAMVRSFIFLTYLITNVAIVSGVIRHWNNNGNNDIIHNEVLSQSVNYVGFINN